MTTAFAENVAALAQSLCDPPRGESDPLVADEITEGRVRFSTATQRYSWCGDFVTYVLWACGGICDPSVLNRYICGRSRNPDDGIGRNISKLVDRGRATGTLLTGNQAVSFASSFECRGSVYLMESPGGGHVGIVLGPAGTGRIATADGNTMNRATGTNVRSFGGERRILAIIPADAYYAGGEMVAKPSNPEGGLNPSDPLASLFAQVGAAIMAPVFGDLSQKNEVDHAQQFIGWLASTGDDQFGG